MLELKWQRKRKNELVCYVAAETSGIAQTDVAIARQLKE